MSEPCLCVCLFIYLCVCALSLFICIMLRKKPSNKILRKNKFAVKCVNDCMCPGPHQRRAVIPRQVLLTDLHQTPERLLTGTHAGTFTTKYQNTSIRCNSSSFKKHGEWGKFHSVVDLYLSWHVHQQNSCHRPLCLTVTLLWLVLSVSFQHSKQTTLPADKQATTSSNIIVFGWK